MSEDKSNKEEVLIPLDDRGSLCSSGISEDGFITLRPPTPAQLENWKNNMTPKEKESIAKVHERMASEAVTELLKTNLPVFKVDKVESSTTVSGPGYSVSESFKITRGIGDLIHQKVMDNAKEQGEIISPQLSAASREAVDAFIQTGGKLSFDDTVSLDKNILPEHIAKIFAKLGRRIVHLDLDPNDPQPQETIFVHLAHMENAERALEAFVAAGGEPTDVELSEINIGKIPYRIAALALKSQEEKLLRLPFSREYERNGKLICFEGADGAGKSTQIEKTYDYLKQQGMDVIKLREPGGTEVGEKIRDILLKGGLDPYTELLLFTAARMQLVQTKIIPALEAGKIVLLDRYIYSTKAYQGGGRGIQQEADLVTTSFFEHVMPDHVVYLQMPLEAIVQRRQERYDGTSLDTFESEAEAFQARLIESFDNELGGLKMMDEEAVVIIDATQSLEKVTSEVKAWLDKNILP